MALRNAEIAAALEEIANFLEIKGENPFRVRAYRTAALSVLECPRPVAAIAADAAKLAEMPGVGSAIALKIQSLAGTGAIPFLEDLRKELPIDVGGLLRVRGLGARKIKALWSELGVADAAALRAACAENRVSGLRGFGEKTQAAILRELDRLAAATPVKERMLLHDAERTLRPLLEHVQAVPGVLTAQPAGSFRRRVETIGDLDVLVTAKRAGPVVAAFAGYEGAERALSRGPRKSSIVLHNGVQADLRVFPPGQAGAALHYFTGSKAHNVAVRTLAVKKGLKLNEYGVFRGARRIAGADEAGVFAAAGLPYIEPELRENRGEIEAARDGRLPRPVTLADIRGDLHVHSVDSDGRATIEEIAEAARARGYAYVAISDHTQRLAMARGLTPSRLAAQRREIERVNARLRGVVVLASSEVDILEDGRLDLPDAALRELDLAIASVHSQFRLSRERQTERILRALDNPNVAILGHPTGRILNRRPPYEVDLERVMAGARERGVALELNAYPDRLDLCDVHCRRAKELGIAVSIASDAHDAGGLGDMRFGVDQARRGWLEAGDVLNTLGLAELRKRLKRA